MKINHDQLSQHLQPLKNVYLICGSEPLLIEETLEAIRHAAMQQQIEHRNSISITSSFNWAEFNLQAANFSLFSERKLVELRFSQKVNKDAAEGLTSYLEKNIDDNVLVIIMDKLDAAAQKSSWFTLLNKNGVYLQLWPPTPQQFPQWIKQRMQTAGLTADQETIALLCERTQGNLLAAQQEIEKLLLTFGKKRISLEDILNHGSEQGQYDVFALVDSVLARQPQQTSKILSHLKETGIEPPIILWALCRELRQLITIAENVEMHGMHLSSAMQKAGVWEKRKPLLQHYLQQVKLKKLYNALQKAAHIDQMIKGLKPGNVWKALLALCLI